MAFNTISDLLKGRSEKKGLAKQVEAAMLLEFFKIIVIEDFGEDAHESMRALYVKSGTMVVAVLSPVIAQELKLREQDIIARVNDKAGSNVVKQLRFLS